MFQTRCRPATLVKQQGSLVHDTFSSTSAPASDVENQRGPWPFLESSLTYRGDSFFIHRHEKIDGKVPAWTKYAPSVRPALDTRGSSQLSNESGSASARKFRVDSNNACRQR